MKEDCDRVSLIKIKPESSSLAPAQNVPAKENITNEIISINKNGKTIAKNVHTVESGRTLKRTTSENDEAAEERQRTGRYLAIGVTLIMLFIAFYHTLLRHATVLAGLLAPAIIMLLYILWLFYFAKKKKTQVSAV